MSFSPARETSISGLIADCVGVHIEGELADRGNRLAVDAQDDVSDLLAGLVCRAW